MEVIDDTGFCGSFVTAYKRGQNVFDFDQSQGYEEGRYSHL